jgi:hypothetical protein
LPVATVYTATAAALQALRDRKLLTFRRRESDPGPQWLPTHMGLSVFESGMETEAGIALYSRLEEAGTGLFHMTKNPSGMLHLIFVVIQVNSFSPACNPSLRQNTCH